MNAPTLEQVIRQHISLNPRPNSRGFFSVLCKVCNDHGKKGPRAGFKFEGKAVGYNCFNCGHSAGFDPYKHKTMPKDMVVVLDSFGVQEVDWGPVLFDAMLSNEQERALKEEFKSIEPPVLQMPDYFYPLTDDPNDVWAEEAIYYLTSRKIDWKKHPFHLVRKADHPDNARWYGRLIIPTYKDGNVVFWQGRDLTDSMVKKYLSPSIIKDAVLSGYSEISRYTDEPLYITEGWFDAYHLNGVAIFGSKMTPAQTKWINQSPRQKVVIPDKFGEGFLLAEQALELGWSVSYPDIGSCKDINAAVLKYGEMYTLMTVKENTCDGFYARSQLGIYCEDYGKQSAKKNKKAHS